MLVLVSFGLVLLATILLVVGLLNDDGLTLIYLSIAASAAAAVVLYVAFRKAKPKTASDSAAAPAPLADDIAPTPVDETAAVPVVEDEAPPIPAVEWPDEWFASLPAVVVDALERAHLFNQRLYLHRKGQDVDAWSRVVG